jgi:hypothetical protein
MKSNLYSNLAEQKKTNPSAFADMDEMLLRESILQFHEGKLNESESAEVSALIQLNPHARSILDGILAAEHYGASANGKAWLDGLLERVIAETPVASVPPSSTVRIVSPARNSVQEIWGRIKAFIGFSAPDGFPSGLAMAQGSPLAEFETHLDHQVVSRLWQNEAGLWVLWLLTENVEYYKLTYQVGTEAACAVELILQPDGSYLLEIELGVTNPPASHPMVTRS